MYPLPALTCLEPEKQHQPDTGAERQQPGAAGQPAGLPADHPQAEEPGDGRAGQNTGQQAGQTAHGFNLATKMDGHGSHFTTINQFKRSQKPRIRRQSKPIGVLKNLLYG